MQMVTFMLIPDFYFYPPANLSQNAENQSNINSPFMHSTKQRHQHQAWVDKVQLFVCNCPTKPEPHLVAFAYLTGMWE